MLVRLLLLLFLVSTLIGQSTNRRYFVYRSISGTSNIVTVRTAASSSRPLNLLGATIYCQNSCTWTLTKNGTLTGGSAGTVVALDEAGPAASAAATYDGTVGSPTTVNSFVFPAAAVQGFEGGLRVSGDGKQVTVNLTSGSSGTLAIYLEFSEI